MRIDECAGLGAVHWQLRSSQGELVDERWRLCLQRRDGSTVCLIETVAVGDEGRWSELCEELGVSKMTTAG